MMQAVIVEQTGPDALSKLKVGQIEKPKPGSRQMLVRVSHVGINHTDWKIPETGRYVKQLPIVLGCDFAGTIEKLGGPIQGFQEGQRIFGFTGIGTKNGAFAEYTLVDPEFARPVPDNISNEQAAGMNLCALTAAMAVFMGPGRPLPSQGAAGKGEVCVIWGAATCVGMFCVQWAKAAGHRVIGVCSKESAQCVKDCGCDNCVDYQSPKALDEIRSMAGTNKITLGIDCVGGETATQLAKLMEGGAQAVLSCVVEPPKTSPSNVKVVQISMGDAYEDQNKRKTYTSEMLNLIKEGRMKPIPTTSAGQGLKSIPQAIQREKQGVHHTNLVIAL